MEATSKNTAAPVEKEEEKKRTKWDKFMTFLSMGGFMLFVFLFLGLAIVISMLWK
jgi:hypothetical protein